MNGRPPAGREGHRGRLLPRAAPNEVAAVRILGYTCLHTGLWRSWERD